MDRKAEVIFIYKILFEYLVEMFPRQGLPFPGNIVTLVTDHADKFVIFRSGQNIHTKSALKVLADCHFLPTSFFDGAMTRPEGAEISYFLKPYDSDNSKDIAILPGNALPAVVPARHMIQREILPALYQGSKYDLRVLSVAKRTGEIMIYKNILYRINPLPFVQPGRPADDIAHQFTSAAVTKKHISFFQNAKPDQMPHAAYLTQLAAIVPQIYGRLLPVSNTGFVDAPLDKSYVIGGLDFIPEAATGDLKFLEFNGTPGFNPNLGIAHYQRFYTRVMEFMRGEAPDHDDCLYVTAA